MDIPESGDPADKKPTPPDGPGRSVPGRAGAGPGAFSETDVSRDLADLLDRTDRLLGTGAARGGRTQGRVPERPPAPPPEVREGDRLSTGATGTMLDLLTPARVQVVERETLWGVPGLMDSGSGCNIKPEVSIGYSREEAAEDLHA